MSVPDREADCQWYTGLLGWFFLPGRVKVLRSDHDFDGLAIDLLGSNFPVSSVDEPDRLLLHPAW